MLCRGVRNTLQTEPDLEICGEAVDGQEAVDKARELHPDLVILDINMPVFDATPFPHQSEKSSGESYYYFLIDLLTNIDSPSLPCATHLCKVSGSALFCAPCARLAKFVFGEGSREK